MMMGRKVGSRPLKIASNGQGLQSLRISLSLCSESQENAQLNIVSQIWDAERMSVRWMPLMKCVSVGERS